MDHFDLANQSKEDLRDMFAITSNEKGLATALVEKDFWVTVLLKYLFTKSPWKKNLLFKGGTCLSKCYGAIERFSEDIDLVLDWRVLGYKMEGPDYGETKKQTERINEELKRRSEMFLKDTFVPTINNELSKIIFNEFHIEYTDEGIFFRYPVLHKTKSVRSEILLEIGPRGTWKDAKKKMVTSYVSEMLPELCTESIPVVCTSLERAFCEKLLIIHTVGKRDSMPDRYSRHYYDVYSINKRMSITNISHVINDTVEFKTRFYPGNRYGYDTMVRGQFSLSIPDQIRSKFEDDYDSMKEMIYGNIPSIDELIVSLKKIEHEMNQ